VGDDDVKAIRDLAGLATPMALRVAVTLGLPDRLHGDGSPADDLAAELDVDPVALGLLLAHLATLGVVERTSTGYRTSAYGAHLRAGAGNGLADLLSLDTAGGRAELAFVELAHSVRTGQAAYPHRYGQDFYADLDEHPHLRESFDRQMAHRFRAQLPRIVAGFDWSRFATVVDVGGGRGGLLAAVLTAHPGMRGHLVDLEETAAGARELLGDRAEVTGGSFFDPLPTGGDAYLLFDILHDWDDEQAHRILARCVEAMPQDGRLLVIESLGGVGGGTWFDLTMLVHFGGRDRVLEDFTELASAHGLALESVTEVTTGRSLLEFRKHPI
jgi:hypothetical protein